MAEFYYPNCCVLLCFPYSRPLLFTVDAFIMISNKSSILICPYCQRKEEEPLETEQDERKYGNLNISNCHKEAAFSQLFSPSPYLHFVRGFSLIGT